LEPLKTLQTRGILWSGGSDYPVTPLAARYGLWASTARQTAKGTYGLHPFGMAESVDIHAALRMSRVDQLGDRFHRAALKFGSSRTGSSVFAINNEYDVQTLMHALLATRFDDIRPEEWTPSYAGKSSRTDFLLKRELVVVETKMMRDGLNDARLADELIIDTDRYNCKALFCFVYDPEHRLKNPSGLEADLSRRTDGLLVRIQIRPRV
jgi:hypothetical protein